MPIHFWQYYLCVFCKYYVIIQGDWLTSVLLLELSYLNPPINIIYFFQPPTNVYILFFYKATQCCVVLCCVLFLNPDWSLKVCCIFASVTGWLIVGIGIFRTGLIKVTFFNHLGKNKYSPESAVVFKYSRNVCPFFLIWHVQCTAHRFIERNRTVWFGCYTGDL